MRLVANNTPAAGTPELDTLDQWERAQEELETSRVELLGELVGYDLLEEAA